MTEPFDAPMFGSFEDTGLDSSTCFTSNTRYLPYGHTEETGDGIKQPADPPEVAWEDVKWGDLQKECLLKNEERYENVTFSANQSTIFRYAEYSDVVDVDDTLYYGDEAQSEGNKKGKKGLKYRTRSAVVFQVQESQEWTLDATQYVRSVIMELSLHTGGEYEVFIFIEVSDDAQPIFNNQGVRHKIIERSVPREFQGITHLFNRRLLKHWYPNVHDDVVKPPYTYAPLQLLSLARPDIEFFWLMDVDARYTGHHYNHLETVAEWSKAQPRQVLWEAASQMYMKGVHKSWENFTVEIREAAKKSLIRGPLLTLGVDPIGPDPPLFHRGKDLWGIGEEADMITFGSVFDPVTSAFLARNEVDNFPEGIKHTPRRATAFSSMTRTSKRLLRAMHYGQFTEGMNMAPSMFPASTALHHGLKLVAFPNPIFLDATISPSALEQTFNHPDWGKHTFDSPYKYKDLWRRMTFAIATDEESTFASQLYRRWLGSDEQHTKGLCLPGILLHPIRGL